MIGYINKIIPFSSVDGPGNRTAIFLQGCNFSISLFLTKYPVILITSASEE